ncbi:hypothetical protein [Streptomyces sp. NPDC005141]
MSCIHGDVGLRKTLAVNTNLRDLAPRNTVWLECRKGATLTSLCATLFRALDLPGEVPAALRESAPIRPALLVLGGFPGEGEGQRPPWPAVWASPTTCTSPDDARTVTYR